MAFEVIQGGRSEPVPTVVRMLETLLDGAKAGRVRSLMFSVGMDDGSDEWGIVGPLDPYAALARLARLQHRANLVLDAQVGPPSIPPANGAG